MSIFAKKEPWYAAGLAFECAQCGRCCSGPEEGYVWVTDEEITRIAAVVGITPEEMRRTCLRREHGKYTIVEQPRINDCHFLRPDPAAGGAKRCTIYDVRPQQCRTWPFWLGNISGPDTWASAGRKCPGINRGKLFTKEEIEHRSTERPA